MIQRIQKDGYVLVIDRSGEYPVAYRVNDGDGDLGAETIRLTNNGLGDRLERELTRMGITQDRYKEIKKRFGFPPTCSCDKRKEWLNRVGNWIGV